MVALDLPKNMYKEKINRNEWMARNIADRIPGKTASIRGYLDSQVPSLKAFSIGQVIDEELRVCDFTRVFGPAEGAVAVDCDCERFKGWKIGVTSAIAIKETEPCQLFDGLIVY